MSKILTESQKNKQIKKEVIASLLLYFTFFLWWYCTGYGLAETGNPETYHYILGLPMWFFLSSVVGYILFSAATVIVVKTVFRDFELGKEKE